MPRFARYYQMPRETQMRQRAIFEYSRHFQAWETDMVDQKAIEELHNWMCDGAQPYADGRSIVSKICEKLVAAGIPVSRHALFILTIHPIVKGRRLSWTPGEGTIIRETGFALFDTDEYHRNPMPDIERTRQPVRRRLMDPDCPHDYRIVGELIEEGYTDYFAQPVIYIDGEVHTMTWSTRDPEGFSDEAIAALERIRAPLSRLVEIYLVRLNAANIISTYVGRNAGDAVLRGRIKRGDAEEISAAILFADLKGYTELSNRKSLEDVIDALNSFYDALEEPILEKGGEILKFMGDGLLAIFPVGEGEKSPEAVAELARQAIFAARDDLEAKEGHPGFRSALHIGKLFYGNIGASRRLDFTAIGPAVNLTARLLAAAASTGCDDVCSQEIAALLGQKHDRITEMTLKGFDEPKAVFALAGSG
jgi:adenylate cyclase